MSDPRLSPVLDRIDEAILDPTLWTRALDAISDMVGGGGVAILSHTHDLRVWSRVDPSLQTVFYTRFSGSGAEANPIQAGVNRLLQDKRFAAVTTDRTLVDRSVFTRSAYFNEFMRCGDAESSMVVDLNKDGAGGFLNLSRGGPAGEFTPDDVKLMTALQPRLARSIWLSMKLSSQSLEGDAVSSLLQRSMDAVFVVDATGRVTRANPAAEALTREPGGFSIRQGRLLAPSARLTERLHALIAVATARDGHGGVGELAAPTSERRRALAVTVAPVRSEAAMAGFGGRAALVFVTDLDSQALLPEQRLAALFDLTPAETRVVLALFAGSSPREAAAALDVSFFTVRAHLVSIFRKTDTNSQAELARLLARIANIPAR